MPAGDFVVRDSREGSFLWVDKQLMAYLSRTMGNSAVVVYSWLCYYSSAKKQNCFPSVSTLAEHANLSRRSIIRIVKRLEKIKVIVIEREKGRVNVYKLLQVDVEKLPQTTGDMSDTSVQVDTGVVSPVSQPVVTPGTLEQYLIEQDILNKKTDVSISNLWISSVLPYPSPSTQSVNELEQLCKDLLGEVNLFVFIFQYRKHKGYPPHPDVLIRLCKQFKNDQVRISNTWGWFKRTVDSQSRQFFSDMHVREHEALKKEPVMLGDILQQIGSRR